MIWIGDMKSCDFYCKRHILAWIHVDWAILRQNWLGGSDLQGWAGKKECQKVSDSHGNDVSLITEGLCYRAACDTSDDCLPLEASETVTWHTVDCSSQWRCETVIVIVIMVSVTLVTGSVISLCVWLYLWVVRRTCCDWQVTEDMYSVTTSAADLILSVTVSNSVAVMHHSHCVVNQCSMCGCMCVCVLLVSRSNILSFCVEICTLL